MWLLAVALSWFVGVSLGMLGGGGSMLTVPILRYVAGLDGHASIATSLCVVLATSLAALVPHARRGRVRFRSGLVFGLSGMLGAALGARLGHGLSGPLLLAGLAVVMLATAAAMLRERSEAPCTPGPGRGGAARTLAQGFAVGVLTGLLGAGGGFLVVPALALFGGMPMPVAVGTSLLVISMNSAAGLLGSLGHAAIDWPLALAASGAAVLGSVAGSRLAGPVSAAALREGFGWFVLFMAIVILGQELPGFWGLPPKPLWSLLGAGLACLGVAVSRCALGRTRGGLLCQVLTRL